MNKAMKRFLAIVSLSIAGMTAYPAGSVKAPETEPVNAPEIDAVLEISKTAMILPDFSAHSYPG